jgi:hypothetical protein
MFFFFAFKTSSEKIWMNGRQSFFLLRILPTSFDYHFFRHRLFSFLISKNVFITERAIDMSHKIAIRSNWR